MGLPTVRPLGRMRDLQIGHLWHGLHFLASQQGEIFLQFRCVVLSSCKQPSECVCLPGMCSDCSIALHRDGGSAPDVSSSISISSLTSHTPADPKDIISL